jgi:crotonobetainyl-CoA:carnitine CoA-transferase CaiB-like acyl-CoA transferase
MQGALDGLVVLDATQMLAGPLCSMRLGDLGADVIKVEPPTGGEFNRTHGFDDVQVGGDMTTFLAVNRNKRSFAVDLKSADGLAAFLDLVRTADVLVQNFRHGTAERLGVGYAQLAAVNPRLVYCSISGYGSAGPYRDRPGQDLVLQGYSGSMFSVGAAGDAPVPGALWAADVMTGYTAAIGILAALASRTSTGAGQHVEVDMFSVVLDAQVQELVTYLNAGAAPRRMQEPTAHGSIPAPYGVYRTADGWMTLAMSPLPALGERPRRRVAAHAGPLQRRARAPRRGLPAHPDRFTGRTTADWARALRRARRVGRTRPRLPVPRRRPARPGDRHDHRAAAPHARRGAHDRGPGAAERNTGEHPTRGPTAGGGHRRHPARAAGLRRRADRTAGRLRRGLARARPPTPELQPS